MIAILSIWCLLQALVIVRLVRKLSIKEIALQEISKKYVLLYKKMSMEGYNLKIQSPQEAVNDAYKMMNIFKDFLKGL